MADISKIQVPIDGVMQEFNIKGSGGSANYYGTCTGQASNQIKAVTISNDHGFELKTGVLIFVKFDANNLYVATSSSPIKLNVNNTGAKQIYADDTATPTGTNTTFFGKMNCINQYMYNGTYWVWNGTSSEDEGGSGSGGHTIINESGTSLAQEPNLQFKGVDVSDDSTNNRTVVDMSYTEIDYEDWLELTEQEKETGRWDVIGVPGADGTVSFDLMTKLWENPDPTQTYSTGTIILSSSDYDILLFQFAHTNTNIDLIISAITEKGKNVLANEVVSGSSNPCRIRGCDYVSDTSYDVHIAYSGPASASITNQSSNALIPYKVYGIKTSQTVEIKAIAPEVSTSASKCMMSDGETSVEEAIDDINDVEATNFAITGFEGTFSLERVGRICFITYNESATSLPAGYLTFSQTLPERFRPTHQVCVHSDASSEKVILFFNSDGTIIGYNYSGAISSRTTCRFGTLSYPALNV